eukprot:827175_1
MQSLKDRLLELVGKEAKSTAESCVSNEWWKLGKENEIIRRSHFPDDSTTTRLSPKISPTYFEDFHAVSMVLDDLEAREPRPPNGATKFPSARARAFACRERRKRVDMLKRLLAERTRVKPNLKDHKLHLSPDNVFLKRSDDKIRARLKLSEAEFRDRKTEIENLKKTRTDLRTECDSLSQEH